MITIESSCRGPFNTCKVERHLDSDSNFNDGQNLLHDMTLLYVKSKIMNLEGSSNLLFENNFTRGKTFSHHTFSKRDQKFYTRSVRECRFSPSAPYHHQHTVLVHPFTTTTRKTEKTKHPHQTPPKISKSINHPSIIISYHTLHQHHITTTPLNTHTHSPPLSPSPYARKPRTYKSIPLPAPNSRSRFRRFCRLIEL